VLVALLIVQGLERPALKAAASAAPAARGGKLNVVADDALALPAGGMPMLEAPRSEQHLAGARAIAKDNPAAVANIVRGWVNREAA
jgi:flagellar M-ring protein FliF